MVPIGFAANIQEDKELKQMQSFPLHEPRKFCLTREILSPMKMQFSHQVALAGTRDPYEREI